MDQLTSRAMFTEDECQWNANSEIGGEVKQPAGARGKVKEREMHERGDGDEDDQSVGGVGMMENGFVTNFPKERDDRQRKGEIENAETPQGKERHYLWKDPAVRTNVTDLRD